MSEKVFKKQGSKYITEMINAAVEDNSRTATIEGNWEIEEAVRIPSDFTLVLDGCHLKMADDTFCNMFVNENHDTDLGRTMEGTDRNISILGKNGAILDGGKYNGLSEGTQRQNGLPSIWENNLIFFTNVDGLEISNIACHNHRWWAINCIYCANGKIHDIDFKSCDIGIDENGNEYHGLQIEKYREVLVKNADGIDLRQGCHHFEIENITGFIEDDTVALTALNGRLEQTFCVEGLPSEISNVTVKKVHSASYCSNVRLLCQSGMKMHDILVEDVLDCSAESPHMDQGYYSVRVGDDRLYGTRQAEEGEVYNITVRNVRSRANIAAMGLGGVIGNLVLENIEGFDGTPTYYDKRIK